MSKKYIGGRNYVADRRGYIEDYIYNARAACRAWNELSFVHILYGRRCFLNLHAIHRFTYRCVFHFYQP